MQSPICKQWKTSSRLTLSLKCGAALLLILLSVLVVACGGGTSTNAATLGDPQTTLTIQIGGGKSSPTPPLPGEWCGIWTTNPTPAYTTGKIAVYAKFTKNVDGNPAGIGGAQATATVMWTPSDTETYVANTTSDGLAFFSISVANKAFAVNTITLVTVTFQKSGVPDCTVNQDRAAFFTLVYATPTTTATKTPTSKGGKKTPTPTPTPPAGTTPTPTTPLPTPTPTPPGGPGVTPTLTIKVGG